MCPENCAGFLCSLNANAGAIQAFSSVVTLLVTVGLVFFNIRAANGAKDAATAAHNQFLLGQRQFDLAQKQFQLSQKQFGLSAQPKLIVDVGYSPNTFYKVDVGIQNAGSESAQVHGVFLELQWISQQGVHYIPEELLLGAPFVLGPGENRSENYSFDRLVSESVDSYGSITTERLHLAVYVNSSDLSGDHRACFVRDTYGRGSYSEQFFVQGAG
jgi:hypothetical protein